MMLHIIIRNKKDWNETRAWRDIRLHRKQKYNTWKRAVDVFGDETKAGMWLRTPNQALGGLIPLKLMHAERHGYKKVRTILGRIEYGVYS